MPSEVHIVWIPRVVIRENGVSLDVPHNFNPETLTLAVGDDATREQVCEAAFAAGMYCGQTMPQELADRVKLELPVLDVNENESLEEDDGLFG